MRARDVGEMCAGEMDDLQGDNDAEERWKEACRREEAIRDLLSGNPDGLKGRDVADLAWELGLSRATAYRMIRLFRAGGSVTSLMDRTRGRREGFRTLDKEREEIIRQAIAGFYLKPTRPPFSKLCRQILVSCEKAGLQPPNWRTIKARVEDVYLQTRGRRRGETEIVKATTPTPGDYRASRPLEIVQIDHTKVDAFVVDEETRKPVGRPWLTLALDVFTRMVTGFYLTMEPEPPSRLSTSLCLLHAVFDKTAWLREREIEGAWPVAGLPENIHVDNGADFRSRAFERACRDEAPSRRTSFWRTHRTPDRDPNGTDPSPAGIHFQQHPGTPRIRLQAACRADAARTRTLYSSGNRRTVSSDHPFNIAATASRGLARARILDKASSAAGSNEVLDLLLAGGRAHASPRRDPFEQYPLLVLRADRRCRSLKGQIAYKI